jgi:hypothetical protein
VFEPKRRIIHAACFPDRVLHHAVIAHAGTVLERAMVPTSFACRPGKGALAAMQHAQAAIRRYPWYVKIDICGYMDDVLWWCDSKAEAKATLAEVKSYAAQARRLEVKDTAQINRSRRLGKSAALPNKLRDTE